MVYFVRHGKTDWNREPVRCQGWADVGLNEAGPRQAREQGSRLRGAGTERFHQMKAPNEYLLELPCEALAARVDSFLLAGAEAPETP